MDLKLGIDVSQVEGNDVEADEMPSSTAAVW